jgi:hypothetical protein
MEIQYNGQIHRSSHAIAPFSRGFKLRARPGTERLARNADMLFSEYWPSWPGERSSTLVHLNAQMSVDELFMLIFGPESRFQVSISQLLQHHTRILGAFCV